MLTIAACQLWPECNQCISVAVLCKSLLRKAMPFVFFFTDSLYRAGFLFFKAISVANADSDRQNKADGYWVLLHKSYMLYYKAVGDMVSQFTTAELLKGPHRAILWVEQDQSSQSSERFVKKWLADIAFRQSYITAVFMLLMLVSVFWYRLIGQRPVHLMDSNPCTNHYIDKHQQSNGGLLQTKIKCQEHFMLKICRCECTLSHQGVLCCHLSSMMDYSISSLLAVAPQIVEEATHQQSAFYCYLQMSLDLWILSNWKDSHVDTVTISIAVTCFEPNFA